MSGLCNKETRGLLKLNIYFLPSVKLDSVQESRFGFVFEIHIQSPPLGLLAPAGFLGIEVILPGFSTDDFARSGHF